MKILKKILDSLLTSDYNRRRQWAESYLSKSVDLTDLEYRQRELTRMGVIIPLTWATRPLTLSLKKYTINFKCKKNVSSVCYCLPYIMSDHDYKQFMNTISETMDQI